MKITLSYTPGEVKQAQRVQAVLVRIFGPGRVHSSQIGEHRILHLTFRF